MGYRELTGFDVENEGAGESIARLTVTEDHLNRGGVMHGGAIATLCDSVMGNAVFSAAGGDKSIATASINITYLAAAVPGDELTARGMVRKAGKTMIFVEAEVTRGDGREIATAIATFVVRERRS